MEKYFTIESLVINKKTIKETDLLITLLTPKKGKIIALAKGVKNIKSKRLGNLQLGNIIKAHIYSKNDFFWISETESISPFLQKNKNLIQINLLFYFLEILNRFIAENQHIENVYEISQKIVNAINKNFFIDYIKNEINFIKVLGFGLPSEITIAYNNKDYKTCQMFIKKFFESIIEKPLESNKLFK